MLLSLLSGGDFRDVLISLLLSLPVIILALSAHEAAHGYVAYKMGDRTAYNLGRVTLNPIKHLDLMGTIWMLVFGYGWAKPVPINARNFKNPKYGMAFTAIAGPAANLLLGIIGVIGYCITSFFFAVNLGAISQNEMLFNVMFILLNFFYLFGMMNLIFMVFNLIPVPPFDGSRFFGIFLPTRVYFGIMKYERYILIGVLVVTFLCSRFLGFSPASWIAEKLFDLIAKPIFSLLNAIYF